MVCFNLENDMKHTVRKVDGRLARYAIKARCWMTHAAHRARAPAREALE